MAFFNVGNQLKGKRRCGRTGVMRRWIKSDSNEYIGGVYGVFPQYAIGFDTMITKTYNLRKI